MLATLEKDELEYVGAPPLPFKELGALTNETDGEPYLGTVKLKDPSQPVAEYAAKRPDPAVLPEKLSIS